MMALKLKHIDISATKMHSFFGTYPISLFMSEMFVSPDPKPTLTLGIDNTKTGKKVIACTVKYYSHESTDLLFSYDYSKQTMTDFVVGLCTATSLAICENAGLETKQTLKVMNDTEGYLTKIQSESNLKNFFKGAAIENNPSESKEPTSLHDAIINTASGNADVIHLAEATEFGQLVYGTNVASVYIFVAKNKYFNLAVRLIQGKLSVRACLQSNVLCVSSTEFSDLVLLGLDSQKANTKKHYSIHTKVTKTVDRDRFFAYMRGCLFDWSICDLDFKYIKKESK